MKKKSTLHRFNIILGLKAIVLGIAVNKTGFFAILLGHQLRRNKHQCKAFIKLLTSTFLAITNKFNVRKQRQSWQKSKLRKYRKTKHTSLLSQT